jgi:hypothetical protein
MQNDEGRKMKVAKELILRIMIAFTLRLNATSAMDAISVQENGAFLNIIKDQGSVDYWQSSLTSVNIREQILHRFTKELKQRSG